MSEQLAFIRKKGGGLAKVTEKVLWSNPSLSSEFVAQTVNLSDDMNNYDYLKVSYVNYNGSAGTNDPYNIIIPVSDFKTSRFADSTRHNTFTFGGIYVPSNNMYIRQMVYNTDTSVKFGTCTQVGGTATTNNNAIPLQIVGLNIATDDKYTEYETVALGQATSTVTTAVSIALNDTLSNYEYIVISLTAIANVDGGYLPSTPTNPIQSMAEVEYFKRNNITGGFAAGNSGSASHQTTTFAYVDDTHITAQKTTSASRTYYVYGIKATRKEKKPYTETVLWTNSAPTSNFADQNVTLSDSITNYKYIAIRIRFSTTESASATTIVSTSDFVTMTNTTTSGHPLCFVGGRYSNVYERAVYYVDATTVKFGSSFQQNSTSVSNGTVIPLEILGLNELDHGKRFDETTLWTNANPTSSFAAQNVTLSDNLSNYDYFKIKFRLSTTQDTSAMVMDSVSDFLTNYSNLSSTWRGTMFYTTSTAHLIRRFRNVDSSGSEIRFMATMTCTISDHTWTDSSGNLTYLIPTEIIGCKFR